MSKTGAIFRLHKASSNAPFQEERPLPGGCNVTIQMGMLIQCFGFEI